MEQYNKNVEQIMTKNESSTKDSDLSVFLKQEFSVQTNQKVQEQCQYFQRLLSQDYLKQCQKHCESKIQNQQDMLQNIDIKNFEIKEQDLNDLRFFKFVSDLNTVFLFFNKQTYIIVLNIENGQTKKVEYDKDKVTALQWDSISDVFVFGHQSGKISFAMYKGGQFIQCFSDIKDVTNQQIANIDLIYGTDAICIITEQNVSELLVKFRNNNSYQIFHLLKMSSRNFYRLCSYYFYLKELDRIKVLLSLVSQQVVFVIHFELIFDKGEFKELSNLKILKKIQIQSKDDQNKVSVCFQKLDEIDKVCFFVSDGNSVDQYQIDTQEQVLLIRKLYSQKSISDMIAPQNMQLYVLDNKFNLQKFIKEEQDSVNKNSDDLENHLLIQKEIHGLENQTKVTFNYEIEEKGFIFVIENKLILVEFLSWQKYIDKQLEQENYVQALRYYINLTKNHQNNIVNKFQFSDVEELTQRQQIIAQIYDQKKSTYAVQLLNQSKTKLKENFHEVVGLCIEIIFMTSNFNFFMTEYLDEILNPQSFSYQNMIEILFHITANLNHQNINGLTEIFFVKLFKFCSSNNDCLKETQKFLVFISINYPLNLNTIQTLKELSKIYNLEYYNMLFYLTNPQNLDYFDMLLERKNFNQIVCIFYDFWQQKQYFQIIQTILKKEQSMQELQMLIKMWLLMNYENILTFECKKLIWITTIMNEQNFSYIEQQNIILTGIDIKFAQILQQIYQKREDEKILIVIFGYKITFPDSVFSHELICQYFIRILDSKILQQIKDEYNYDFFCMSLLKIFIQYRKVLTTSDNFRAFLQNKNNKEKLIILLSNETFEKIEENFDFYLQQNWYFEILRSYLTQTTGEDQQKYIKIFKNRCLEILQKDEDKFEKLFSFLQISDKMQVIEQVKDTKVKKKLFMQITEKEQQYLIGGGILQVLKFKCLFQPSDVIDYLNSNYYSIPEAIKVCEETRCKRGKCYLMYKQGMYQEAEILYKDYLKELWLDGSEHSLEMVIILIDDIMTLKHDKIDQINFYLKILAYVSTFNGNFEVKRKVTKKIYSKIFSLNFSNIFKQIENLNLQELFQRKRLLSQYLLKNFQTIVDFNDLKDKILVQQNQIITSNFIKQSSQGTQLNIKQCMNCRQIDNISDYYETFLYHEICKMMTHPKCHESDSRNSQQIQYTSCKCCSQQDDLFLTQNDNIKYIKEERYSRNTKKFRKKSMMIDPQKMLQKNFMEIDQVFFQEDKFQKEDFIKLDKQSAKKGLSNLEYSKFYFDVFQLINYINEQRSLRKQQSISLQLGIR